MGWVAGLARLTGKAEWNRLRVWRAAKDINELLGKLRNSRVVNANGLERVSRSRLHLKREAVVSTGHSSYMSLLGPEKLR